MKDKIENIVFYFGGVLIDLDFQRLLGAFKKIGFNDIESQLQIYEREGIFQKYELGEMTADEFRMVIRKKECHIDRFGYRRFVELDVGKDFCREVGLYFELTQSL